MRTSSNQPSPIAARFFGSEAHTDRRLLRVPPPAVLGSLPEPRAIGRDSVAEDDARFDRHECLPLETRLRRKGRAGLARFRLFCRFLSRAGRPGQNAARPHHSMEITASTISLLSRARRKSGLRSSVACGTNCGSYLRTFPKRDDALFEMTSKNSFVPILYHGLVF